MRIIRRLAEPLDTLVCPTRQLTKSWNYFTKGFRYDFFTLQLVNESDAMGDLAEQRKEVVSTQKIEITFGNFYLKGVERNEKNKILPFGTGVFVLHGF